MDPKMYHLFFGQSPLSLEAPEGADEKVKVDYWKVAFRTGEWKLRPGPGGTKLKEPLKIFRDKAPAGHLSMTEIQSAFEAPAKEHVTMPTVHADGTVSDSGFVRQLVIEDVKDEKGDVIESKLWAGCNVTDSAIKLKVEEGSLVGVSAGVLFNYERTEDGVKFPQVMSHLMITNSPWINGCGGFEKKLPEGVMAAEDQPTEHEEISLDSSVPMIDDGNVSPPGSSAREKPPEGTVVWRPEEGFSYMKGKVQRALDNWRRSVLAAMPETTRSRAYEEFPYMRVDDVSHDGTKGKAMIRSGYGDDAVAWVASFKLDEEKDAVVEPFQNWTEAAQEWVAASEEQAIQPAPSSGQVKKAYVPPQDRVEMSDLRRAQMQRDALVSSRNGSTPTNNHGGPPMSKLSELLSSGIELSDEQRKLADEALAEEREAADRAQRDAEAAREAGAKAYLSELDGIGLGEEDTPGLRVVIRDIFMSDDGGTALNLSEETKSGRRTKGEPVTAIDIAKRIVEALPRNKEGKVALSEQARVLPNDAKPPEGLKPGETEDEQDKRSAKEKADALLSEGDGFNFNAPVAGGAA